MMNLLKQLGCIALSVAICSNPAVAFEDADRKDIMMAFDDLISVIETGNLSKTLDIMPPKIIDAMAEQAGVDAATFKAAIIQQLEGVMAQATIEEASYDLDAATIGTSESGRDYAVVPTRTLMVIEGQRLEAVGPSLALEDEGQWYIVRVESPQHSKIIAEVYPDLADVDLPEGTMTPIE